uniref:Protein FAR1-RELATED SEQUENCE n=1 Tax=Triticum urartu TaxID=4572 RepID=A0A8R7R3G5_TRIUA
MFKIKISVMQRHSQKLILQCFSLMTPVHRKKESFSQEAQVLAARDDCDVQQTENHEGIKIMFASDQYKKIREVCYDTTSMTAKCSCKLFESKGIVCRHIIRVFRGAKINELPSLCILKRWKKNCKRDIVYDGEGNVLEENLIDLVDIAVKRKIVAMRDKLEDLIGESKHSMEGIEFLHNSLCGIELGLAQLVSTVPCNTQENEELCIGSVIPKDVTILHLRISMQGAHALE